jgi:hypothetical protein
VVDEEEVDELVAAEAELDVENENVPRRPEQEREWRGLASLRRCYSSVGAACSSSWSPTSGAVAWP